MVDSLVKNMTHIIFWCVVLCSTLSILVVLSSQKYTFLLGLSLVMNVWSIIQSERNGFVKAKEMRRAFEPPRHFSGFQILVVILLILAEIGVGVVVILL